MNRRIVVALMATSVMGGVVVVFLPQHATSIARLGATTVAALTAALVLAAVGPVVARDPEPTALDHLSPVGASPLDPHGLRDARRDLDRPTAPGGVPPAVRDRLLECIETSPHRIPIPPVLARTPAAGSGRDPVGVAAIVNRILDEVEQGAPHGHH